MFKQFLKFSVIGVLNTAITFITYTLLVHFQINTIISNSIGYILGTVNSYFFNNYWVFKAKDKSKEVFTKFIIVNIITLCVSNGLLIYITERMMVEKILAQAFVIPVTTVFNFLLNKFWTFDKKNILVK